MNHIEIAGDDSHMLAGVQAFDQMHGGGARIDVQGVPVLHKALGVPGDPQLFPGAELGALGEQRDLLPLSGTDAAVNLFHRPGIHQIGYVGADGIHGYAEALAQLLHGDSIPPGDQGFHLFSTVVLHREPPFRKIQNFS